MSSVSPHRSRFPQQGSAFSVLAFHHGVVGQVVGRGARVAVGEISWRPSKTPALPCPPAIPGRRDGWADGRFAPAADDGWQHWFHHGTSCGHLAPSHADRSEGLAGWEDRAGAPIIPATACRVQGQAPGCERGRCGISSIPLPRSVYNTKDMAVRHICTCKVVSSVKH